MFAAPLSPPPAAPPAIALTLAELRDRLARLDANFGAVGSTNTVVPKTFAPKTGAPGTPPLAPGWLAPLFAAGHAFGGLHEVVAAGARDLPAASGFALDFVATCAKLRPRAGLVLIVEDVVAWEAGLPYGPGLVEAGFDPAKLVIVRTHAARETLMAMETALRSRAVAGVIAESAVTPKLYDLAASRRLLLAARTGGGAALFLPTAFSGQAAKLSSAATVRFEIARAQGRAIPFGRARLPMPGRPAFAFRLLKAPGGLTDAAARSREQWQAGVFGIPLDEAAFHAFSFNPPAVPRDRPASSPPAPREGSRPAA